jgi:hypothetical protein
MLDISPRKCYYKTMTDNTQFIELVKSFEGFSGDDTITVRPYSGRCMYGRECIGIVTQNPLKVLQEIAHTAGEEGIRMPAHVEWDSMGRETIVYWPYVEYQGEFDEESEEE